jgi:hypothetical protein
MVCLNAGVAGMSQWSLKRAPTLEDNRGQSIDIFGHAAAA